MDRIFGFIGAGNMGGALARAAARKLPGRNIVISNRTPEKAEALAAELGARAVSNAEVAVSANYIFLGVKPQMMQALFARSPSYWSVWRRASARTEYASLQAAMCR